MPLPADAVKLPPEVERFLERLASLPTIAWLVAVEEFGVARHSKATMPPALKSLTSATTEASRSPWEATRLQLAWGRVDELLGAVRPLVEAQAARYGLEPYGALGLTREAAIAAVTALVLCERLSAFAWTLYAPFAGCIPRRGLHTPP
jgi:hypothetical protein